MTVMDDDLAAARALLQMLGRGGLRCSGGGEDVRGLSREPMFEGTDWKAMEYLVRQFGETAGERLPPLLVATRWIDDGVQRGPSARETRSCPATPARRLVVLLAALTDPGQALAHALAALGIHRALEIEDVGADSDARRCGMHFGPPVRVLNQDDSVRFSFK